MTAFRKMVGDSDRLHLAAGARCNDRNAEGLERELSTHSRLSLRPEADVSGNCRFVIVTLGW